MCTLFVTGCEAQTHEGAEPAGLKVWCEDELAHSVTNEDRGPLQHMLAPSVNFHLPAFLTRPPACLGSYVCPWTNMYNGTSSSGGCVSATTTIMASACALTSSGHGLGKAAREIVACGDAPDPGLPQAERKLRYRCRHLQPVSLCYMHHMSWSGQHHDWPV